jgi:hypothetical protein
LALLSGRVAADDCIEPEVARACNEMIVATAALPIALDVDDRSNKKTKCIRFDLFQSKN